MKTRAFVIAVLSIATCTLGIHAIGCGSDNGSSDDAGSDGSGDDASLDGTGGDDSGGFGDSGDGSTFVPACGTSGKTCAQGTDCCSGVCDPASHTCTTTVGSCLAGGAKCGSPTDCCTLVCNANGTCGANQCVSDNQPCTSDFECCGGTCGGGSDGGGKTCTPLNGSCKSSGNSCSDNTQCCSKLCQNGTCALASSYCVQPGDICSTNGDCCGGICNIASGKLVGTCATQPAGPANCTGVDGVVCNDCGTCCSRECAPYAPTGVKICQPANGCHVEGDLCHHDSDCCGGAIPGVADAGTPGYGNVTCVIQPGFTVGICRGPTGCNPEGNVCHYQNYGLCDISSARNDCCSFLGSKSDCTPDTNEVPRCKVIGGPNVPCRNQGESCADSSNCCNGALCLPAAGGGFTCGAPSAVDGGSSCQPQGQVCTTTSDCCVGYTCVIPPGQTFGTCGTTTVTGGGGDGGADGGGATTNDAGVLQCAAYGQSCMTSSDCCNNVPCTLGGSSYCTGSTVGCSCLPKVN